MHRSGTSCLAGSLQKRGLFMGQVHESNPYNRKGNRENQKFVDLNDKILQYNNAGWDKPPSGNLVWNADHCRELETAVSEFNAVNHACWGFKDPRTLLTLEFWLSRLSVVKFIGSVRHPLLVAKSLQSRNGFAIEQGLGLWLSYNERLLGLLEQGPFPVISFDVEPDDYIRKVGDAAKQLGLPGTIGETGDFYDRELISQSQVDEHELPETVKAVYGKILTYVA
jgi:hypothetical protein